MSFFSESDLPGIGKKVSCTTHSKEKVVLVIHNDGKREFYIMDKEGDPQASVTLLDEEARRLGGFLSGVMFKPKSVENLELALEGIRIDWYKLDKNSPVIGKKLGGLGIRKNTQVSIIAILKETEFIPNPSSDYVFEAGDTCVVIGKPEKFKDFLEIVRPAQG
ncbi:MAG: cation:proton antiporter regulatory subunit [Clostridia bacterium]|nr:cation:proton antiporter regulatory subunit [Clostridia bacterium]